DRAQVQSDKLTLLGTAPAFRRAIELARKVAPTDASVFITGESGSGKEMIAQFIHHHSRRSSRPFIAINCAALPEGLLESEMFGHRKGARNYAQDLRQFLEFLKGGGAVPTIHAVDQTAVRGFLAFRTSKGDGKATRGRKLAAVRSLFKFLARDGAIVRSPAAGVLTPKMDKKLPKVLTADDAKRLMEDNGARKPRSLRDQAILETLYSSGARVAELVALNIKDVDLDGGTATVLGK